jgi:hypothetical protein
MLIWHSEDGKWQNESAGGDRPGLCGCPRQPTPSTKSTITPNFIIIARVPILHFAFAPPTGQTQSNHFLNLDHAHHSTTPLRIGAHSRIPSIISLRSTPHSNLSKLNYIKAI